MSLRPERSDAHLSPEEEVKRSVEVRDYFEGMEPKRHTKPSRSEHSAVYSDAVDLESGGQGSSPELDRFRDLEESDTQKLVRDGSEGVDEYTETEYYKDLNCVDNRHHTTGTGFIKMEQPDDNSFHLTPDTDASDSHASCRGNPATNDWIPSADTVVPFSGKPNRSDI